MPAPASVLMSLLRSVCYTEPGSCHCCLMLQEMARLSSHFHQMLDELEKVYLQTNKTFNQITSK